MNTRFSELSELAANLHFARPEMFSGLGVVLLICSILLVRRRRGFIVLLLRILSLALLFAGLAVPGTESSSSKSEIAVLVDISRSVSDRALDVFAGELAKLGSPETDLEVFAFGKKASKVSRRYRGDVSASEFKDFLRDERERLDSGETNIESALSTAQSRAKSASVVLLSDGFETAGNGVNEALSLRDAGMRIYPIIPSADVFLDRGVSISSLYSPVTASEGDAAEIRVTLSNSEKPPAKGKLEVFLEQEKILSQNVSVDGERERVFVARTSPLKGGLKRIRSVFTPEGGGRQTVLERHRWISVKEKSKLLLLSGTQDDARILRELIRERGYALQDVVADGNAEIPVTFEGISTVIFNNVARSQLPKKFLPALLEFTKAGGGVILVGGDRSFGLGNYIDTPLEDISPVKFVPPQTEKRRLTNAIALVIDKSGSMAYEGKMDAAKRAAVASIEALKDEDYISVIGFDAGPFVIIDVKQVRDARLEAERRLRNLTASGKTDLLPALATARQRLQKAGSSRKHIIVLTDGKIPWSDAEYTEEINLLRRDGVTVSTVALGIEADVPFLQMLSRYGNGAFYRTLNTDEIPRLFVEDIKISTGERTLKEGEDYIVSQGPSGLRSTDVNGQLPTLRGFVETLPKKGSEFELLTKKEDRAFPILASWTFGAGKVIAYTSDANGRWSAAWVRWPEFSRFWSRLLEGVKDKTGVQTADVDFDIRYRLQGRSLIFDLSVFDDKLRTQLAPKIAGDVEEPGGEKRQVAFRAVKKGRFEAKIDSARPGDYRLSVGYGNIKLPPVAITLEGELFGEAPGRGIDVSHLEELAFRSGGKVNPRREELLREKRVISETTQMFAPFLLLAALLLLFEAFVRERGWLKRRPKVKASPTPIVREVGTYSRKQKAA